MPAGQRELTASVRFPGSPGSQVYGALIDPSGSEVTGAISTHVDANGNTTHPTAIQAYEPNPRPGRWRFVVNITNPVGGQVLSAPYSGRIGFAPPAVTAAGLPQGVALTAGTPTTVSVKVRNTGVGVQDVFLDPRTVGRQPFGLLSVTPDQNLPLPIPATGTPPLYLVPTETMALEALAQATEPVTFDFGWGDPDIAATSTGNSAYAYYATHQATPGLWSIAPDPIGPFNGPAPAGKVSTGMVALTRGFDASASSSTGDVYQQTVDPAAPAFNPVTLAPGQSTTLKLTITPIGKPGRRVRGTLFVDEFSGALALGGELVRLPYEYRVK